MTCCLINYALHVRAWRARLREQEKMMMEYRAGLDLMGLEMNSIRNDRRALIETIGDLARDVRETKAERLEALSREERAGTTTAEPEKGGAE